MLKALVIVIVFAISACSTLQVVQVNPETGYFPGNKKATVTKNVSIDLDSLKDLVLVPNGDFTGEMVKNIGYFDEVMSFEDLERKIVQNNLVDKVPSVRDRIGINKAAKEYKKFLWVRWDIRKNGLKEYQQLILTDPVTLEDIFVSETLLDYVWSGVNDQSNWYPMMNSLVDYIKTNSKTFRK